MVLVVLVKNGKPEAPSAGEWENIVCDIHTQATYE